MRLNKFIAHSGVASRRKAEELILAGKVEVNGEKVSDLGHVIDEEKDRVKVNGIEIGLASKKIYLALNKPLGYVCSAKNWQGKSVLELIDIPERIYPVGRLDKDSVGLLILTNDGDFAYQLTQAKFQHEKEYEVVFDRELQTEDIKAFESGMDLDGEKVKPIKVRRVRGNKANLILLQGINRQIRHMAEARGYRVNYLKRIRIGKLKLDDLAVGSYRFIKPEDVLGS